MRIFNFNNPVRLPEITAAKSVEETSKRKGQSAANNLPSGMNSHAPAERTGYLRSRGRRFHEKLLATFTRKTDKGRVVSTQPPAVLLRESLQISHQKFLMHEDDINQAVTNWGAGGESLQSVLTPYIKAGKRIKGTPDKDGLRSSVTSLLNGLEKADSGASEGLRRTAQKLRETVIFMATSNDGILESYTLMNFATPGSLGLGKIDGLNIPQAQKVQIAQRLNQALAELRDLGEAYTNYTIDAPARRMNPDEPLYVSSHGSDNPGAIPGMAAHAGGGGAPRRTGGVDIEAGSRPSAEQRETPANAAPPVRNRRPDATPRGARPLPTPSRARQAAAQTPAFSADSMDDETLAMLAGTYLTTDELNPVLNDLEKLRALAGVIAERANRHAQRRQAGTAHGASAPAPASASRSVDNDSAELLAKSRQYLTETERERYKLEDLVHIIQNRIEDGAVGGEYLPKYEADPVPPSRR